MLIDWDNFLIYSELVGFGTFETRERSARTGRNPQTNEEIKIPASIAPAFKAGKALKEKVNKKFLKAQKFLYTFWLLILNIIFRKEGYP